MSAIINKQAQNNYISNLKATVDTPNGVFVMPSYKDGNAPLVSSSDDGDKAGLLFVNNVNSHIDAELVADADLVTKEGRFLRLKPFNVGDIFTTDQFSGTYTSINEDDVLAVDTGGKLNAIGARTPVLSFKVTEKTTLYGKEALKVVVLTA